jgi:type I restriction enzyme S subunit
MNIAPADRFVPWLSEVRCKCEMKPLKFMVEFNPAVLGEETPDDKRIRYLDISSVNSYGEIIQVGEMQFCAAPSRARRLVKCGDVIISTVRTYLTAIATIPPHDEDLVVSTGFAVLRAGPAVHPRFLSYWTRSRWFVSEIVARSTGVSYPAINSSEIGQLPFPALPVEEQRRIADFLDRETERIDSLIAHKQRVAALLREKRHALISQAVTKSLSLTVPMRDSCVSWLGSVPKHWLLKPLKRVVGFQEGPGIMAVDFRDEGVPLLRVANVSSRFVTLDGCNFLDRDMVLTQWSRFQVRTGDLLISASASMGTVSEVTAEAAEAVPYTGIIRVSPDRKMLTKEFCAFYFMSGLFLTQVDLLKQGSTIQHFGPSHLARMFIVLPPIAEQKTITQSLAEQIAHIDSNAAEIDRSVALLSESRSGIITAAVTGQIDVRNYKAQGVASCQ